MNRWMWIAGVVVALTTAWFARAQERGKQYAFLVGCGGYNEAQLNKLEATINDVIEFQKALVESGFDPAFIKLLHDRQSARFLPERAKILKELDLLLDGVTAEDTVVVALSGHGVHFKGEKTGYFCPIDAKLDDRSTMIAMDGPGGLFERLKACKAKRKLLIVNACRNDPATGRALAANKVNLDDEDNDQIPEGIAAIYSCRQGEKSYLDPKRNLGIFFDHVIRGWKGEYLKGGQQPTLDAFFDEVRARTKVDVDNLYQEKQIPVVRKEYTGTTPWLTRSVVVKEPAKLKAPFTQAEAEAARTAMVNTCFDMYC